MPDSRGIGRGQDDLVRPGLRMSRRLQAQVVVEKVGSEDTGRFRSTREGITDQVVYDLGPV